MYGGLGLVVLCTKEERCVVKGIWDGRGVGGG